MTKKTLILGASTKPNRYAYMAAQRLKQAGHEVVLLGNKEGQVIDQPILVGKPQLADIHTVTLYLNPARQVDYYDYLLDTVRPKRIIFNPGTENQTFMQLAKTKGIEVEAACTLVLLSMKNY